MKPHLLFFVTLTCLLLFLSSGTCFAVSTGDDWSTQPGIGLKAASGEEESSESSDSVSSGYSPKPDLGKWMKERGSQGTAKKSEKMVPMPSGDEPPLPPESKKQEAGQEKKDSSSPAPKGSVMHYYPPQYD